MIYIYIYIYLPYPENIFIAAIAGLSTNIKDKLQRLITFVNMYLSQGKSRERIS